MDPADEQPASGLVQSGFPRSPEDFESDPRVSFSKADQKWILEADDGSEFEYDEALKRWVPVVRSLASHLH